MKRLGFGKGRGKGYKNLLSLDPFIHFLSFKGIKTKQKTLFNKITTLKACANINLLSASEFNKKFANDYSVGEVGHATTKVHPDGTAKIYIKDSGNPARNRRLAQHEKKELKIFKRLIKQGISPSIADEMAHNMNPVKLSGVDNYYPLNPNN